MKADEAQIAPLCLQCAGCAAVLPHIEAAIALNDRWIKNTLTPIREAGRTALVLQRSIDAARSFDLAGEWGLSHRAASIGVLVGLGATSSDCRHVSDARAFQLAVIDRLLSSKNLPDEDADRAREVFASIEGTPEAIGFVLDLAQAKANLDQRKARYFEQARPLVYVAGDLSQIGREWEEAQSSVWTDPVLQRWDSASAVEHQ
ncbi:hypothetical protein WKW77_20030 [Variovorax ureilyticus]|uniref:Uncharacterized protein n=1 Tax=Variovorax ureilyticus TaxID=1836198 RepID=A0ABU8VI95_9BURK